MTGETKPGDALADRARDEFDKNRRERELAIERLRIRSEMRSENWEEDTGVIHKQADERMQQRDEAPTKAGILSAALAFANGFPAWGKVIVALAAIAAYVVLKLAKVVP